MIFCNSVRCNCVRIDCRSRSRSCQKWISSWMPADWSSILIRRSCVRRMSFSWWCHFSMIARKPSIRSRSLAKYSVSQYLRIVLLELCLEQVCQRFCSRHLWEHIGMSSMKGLCIAVRRTRLETDSVHWRSRSWSLKASHITAISRAKKCHSLSCTLILSIKSGPKRAVTRAVKHRIAGPWT